MGEKGLAARRYAEGESRGECGAAGLQLAAGAPRRGDAGDGRGAFQSAEKHGLPFG